LSFDGDVRTEHFYYLTKEEWQKEKEGGCEKNEIIIFSSSLFISFFVRYAVSGKNRV